MNQSTLSVLIEVQKLAQATKEVRGFDSDLKQAAASADAASKDIDSAGTEGAKGLSKASAGAREVVGDLGKVSTEATSTASKLGAAGTEGGKGFAQGAAAVKGVGSDLTRVATDANSTASKMGAAGMEGGRGFSTGAGRGLAGTAGDLSKVSTDARSTAGQVGAAGDQAGQGFAQGVRVAVQRVQGAFGSAVSAAKSTASDFGTAGRQAGQEFADKAEAGVDGLKDKLKAGGALAGAAAGAALAAGVTRAVSLDAANDKLAAQLGLTGKRSKMAGKIAGDLYSGAWGESMEEVNTAVGAVMSSIEGMSNASGGQIKAVTVRALDFATAFDVDVARAVSSVGILMKTGLAKNAKQGFDLVTAASQRVPADIREDVLEAIDEYATYFKGLGYSGKEAFAMLVQGAKGGRIELDKVGDAVKEFQIRSTDMSTTSKDAYKAIGLNARTMADMILAGGGSARKATGQIIDGLLGIKNPSKQAEAAIALFGTPLEDLNVRQIPGFLRAMKGGGGAMDGFAGSSKRMGDTLNDNAAIRLESFKRTVMTAVVRGLGNYAIPALEKFGDVLGQVAGPVGTVIDKLGGIGSAVKGDKASGELGKIAAAAQKFGGVFGDVVDAARSFWDRFGGTITAQVETSLRFFLKFATGVMNILGGIITFITGVLTGDWSQAWDGIKMIFSGVWTLIVATLGAAWGMIKNLVRAGAAAVVGILTGIWGGLTGLVSSIWGAIASMLSGFFNGYAQVVTAVWGAIRSATSAIWNAIKGVLSAVWGAIRSVASSAFNSYRQIVTTAWNAIRSVTTTIWNGLRSFLTGAWNAIKSVASTAWQGVKTVIINPVRSAFEWVRSAVGSVREWLAGAWSTIREKAKLAWLGFKTVVINPIRSAFEWVREAVGNVRERLADAWSSIRGRAADAWGNIKSTIIDAFQGALRGAGRIVNAIIGVVNKLPGVSIGKVDWGGLAKGGSVSRAGVDHAQALAAGGKVTKPMAIVGEQAPAHPEWVIPSNPAYRGRALGLFAQLGDKLGVPGYAAGGVLGDIGRTVTAPGRAVLGVAGRGADWFIDKLPSPADYLPKWLVGLGSHAIDKVTGWIKDKVASLIPKSGPGGGPLNLVGKMTGTNAKAWALAKAFGQTITSGYRSPEHNAAVGGVAGSSHTKGTLANPGAHDFVPANAAALQAATAMGAAWVDMHDFGSGLHNHVSWLAKGGVLDKMGGPQLPRAVAGAPYLGSYKTGGTLPRDGLYYGHKDEEITPKGASVREGPLVHIEHYEVYGDDHDEERTANMIAHKLRAAGVI